MDWKRKALIQNLIAKLPSKLSYDTYYYVQRKFGGLKEAIPNLQLYGAVKIAEFIQDRGQTIQGKTFLEVELDDDSPCQLDYGYVGRKRLLPLTLTPI